MPAAPPLRTPRPSRWYGKGRGGTSENFDRLEVTARALFRVLRRRLVVFPPWWSRNWIFPLFSALERAQPTSASAASDMVRYASEFGFTPAAGSRIAAGVGPTTTSKFGDLLV
jgi:hypothetical protein